MEAVQKLPGCKYNILAKIMNVYLSNESSDDLTYITSLIDEQKSPLLIYSDAVLKNFKTEKKSSALYTAARKIESILSSIAVYAKDHNYHKIIVAGGETSGAVTSRLGYTAFYIGQESALGFLF